jgi:outer membrane protein assembly factor BamB
MPGIHITRLMTVLSVAAILATGLSNSALAASPGNEHFQRTWARHDLPVQQGAVNRTWMWGPSAFTSPVVEHYEQVYQAERNERVVQYFDKARMEITSPFNDPNDPWYVTNGLLVVEMMTGQVQIADDQFVAREPAGINIAGDSASITGEERPLTPTYATLATLMSAPPAEDGAPLVQRLTADGEVVVDERYAVYGVTAAQHVEVDGIDHQIASPFWEFMTASGIVWSGDAYVTDNLFLDPYYATGLPVTEAYWVIVPVAGVDQEVMLQCFERRCLTYTPDNPDGWKVEAGNVGRHYYEWRYGFGPSDYQLSEAIQAPEEYMSAFTISDDGLIYTVLPHPSLIRVHSLDGTFLDQWTLGDGNFHIIDHDIEIGPDGNIYVLDGATWQIWVYTPEGESLEPIPLKNETTRNITGRAAAIAFGDEGKIYVLNQPVSHREHPGTIDVIDREGEILDAWEGIDAIHYGRDIAVANDRIYVATDDGLAILSIDGELIQAFEDIRGSRIAADSTGSLYLAGGVWLDGLSVPAQVTVVDADGEFVDAWLPASVDEQISFALGDVRPFAGSVYLQEGLSNVFQVFRATD